MLQSVFVCVVWICKLTAIILLYLIGFRNGDGICFLRDTNCLYVRLGSALVFIELIHDR